MACACKNKNRATNRIVVKRTPLRSKATTTKRIIRRKLS